MSAQQNEANIKLITYMNIPPAGSTIPCSDPSHHAPTTICSYAERVLLVDLTAKKVVLIHTNCAEIPVERSHSINPTSYAEIAAAPAGPNQVLAGGAGEEVVVPVLEKESAEYEKIVGLAAEAVAKAGEAAKKKEGDLGVGRPAGSQTERGDRVGSSPIPIPPRKKKPVKADPLRVGSPTRKNTPGRWNGVAETPKKTVRVRYCSWSDIEY